MTAKTATTLAAANEEPKTQQNRNEHVKIFALALAWPTSSCRKTGLTDAAPAARDRDGELGLKTEKAKVPRATVKTITKTTPKRLSRLALLLAIVFSMEGGICRAAQITWTNTTGGTWGLASNWNPNQVPGTNDNAYITNNGTYAVSVSASAAVGSLVLGGASGTQTLSLSAGTFTLNGSGSGGTQAVVNISGGTLTGSGLLALAGPLNWSGGIIQSVVQCNGGTVSGTEYLDGGQLISLGTFTWNNPLIFDGAGSVISNALTGTINLTNAVGRIVANNYGPPQTFYNAGQFNAWAGATPATIADNFINTGTLSVNTGTLRLQQGGSIGGSLSAVSGAVLDLYAGAFTAAAPALSGTGLIEFTGDTLTLLNDVIPGLQMNGGTLYLGANFQGGSITNFTLSGASLAGTNTVAGTFTWSGGSILGPFTVSPTGVLNTVGGANLFLYAPLTNAGTINWSNTATFDVYNNNASQTGAVFNQSGGLFVLWTDGQTLNDPNGLGYASFNNSGTVRKSANTSVSYVNMPFTNSGTLVVLEGTLRFYKGGQIGGTLSAASGTLIDFSSGVYSASASAILNGPGIIQLSGGSLTLLNDVVPGLQLTGGTLYLGSNFQGGSITNFTLSGASLAGTNTVTGTFTWSGGSILGPLTVSPTGVLNAAGGASLYLYGPLTNAGTVNWSNNATLHAYNNGSTQTGALYNLSSGLMVLWGDQQDLIDSQGSGYAALNNAGTFSKATTTGVSYFDMPFTNTGTLTVLQGTLRFFKGGQIGGSISASSGTLIDFDGGAYTPGVAPVLSGPGTIQLSAGNLTLPNNVIAGLQLIGGTVYLGPSFQGGSITNLTLSGASLAGTNTVTGALNWTAGSILGPLTVASNGVLNTTGTANLYLYAPLTNAGTVNWDQIANLFVYNNQSSQTGAIYNATNGLFDFQSDGQTLLDYLGSGYATFNNSGTLRKSANTGSSYVQMPFTNNGAVVGLQGTLRFERGGPIQGSFSAAAGATVNFDGGSFAPGAGAAPVLSGQGLVQLSGGTLTLPSNVIPNLLLAGGTVYLGTNFQGGSINNLTLSGAGLAGTNAVTGAMTWAGGSILGPLTIASNGVLNTVGNATLALYGPLTNGGAVNWSNTASLRLYDNGSSETGTINNLSSGVINFLSDGQTFLDYLGSGLATFNNAGTLAKAAAIGTTTISVRVTNSGLVSAQSGTLNFTAGLVPNGGGLAFGLGGLNFYGKINVTGNLTLNCPGSVSWLGGYVPTLTNSFTVLTYGSHAGIFSSLSLPSAALWQTNYGASAFTLTITSISKLVVLSGPSTMNAGATLSPTVVQVEDVNGNPIATNGVPVTVSLATGTGSLTGTLTQYTDPTGRATFGDLSINLVGAKTLQASASASGLSPATTGVFNIIPAVPAQLLLAGPIQSPQRAGIPFSPPPVLLIQDRFGNVVSNSTILVTANLLSGGGGRLSATTNVNGSGTSGTAVFTNLCYTLGSPFVPESMVVSFNSPGLTSVTNNSVIVDFAPGVLTLQDKNSLVEIDPTTQQGMFSWSVDGTNQLYQHWFWVREGAATFQSSLDELSVPYGLAHISSNAVVSYFAPGLTLMVSFTLSGGAFGSSASDVAETLIIQNTTNASVSLHVYEYEDFDLGGDPAGDSVSYPTTNSVSQQGKNMVMSETVQPSTPAFWEASWYDITLVKLSEASPATLSDSFIPQAPGDQTFAYQWDLTVAPTQSATINLAKSIRSTSAPGSSPLTSVSLGISLVGGNVIISWPSNVTAGSQLQTANSLGVNAHWVVVTNTPAVVGSDYQVTVPASGSAQFYRLIER